jgi:hypothetical protein
MSRKGRRVRSSAHALLILRMELYQPRMTPAGDAVRRDDIGRDAKCRWGLLPGAVAHVIKRRQQDRAGTVSRSAIVTTAADQNGDRTAQPSLRRSVNRDHQPRRDMPARALRPVHRKHRSIQPSAFRLTSKIATTWVFPPDAVRATPAVCLSADFRAVEHQRRQHGSDSAWQARRTNAAPKP